MISYFTEKDKERDDISWEVLGDETTEEIVVRATCNGKLYEKRKKSPVGYPAMIDRVFGIDEWDLRMSHEMSNEIYKEILDEGSK